MSKRFNRFKTLRLLSYLGFVQFGLYGICFMFPRSLQTSVTPIVFFSFGVNIVLCMMLSTCPFCRKNMFFGFLYYPHDLCLFNFMFSKDDVCLFCGYDGMSDIE